MLLFILLFCSKFELLVAFEYPVGMKVSGGFVVSIFYIN